MPLPNFLIIGVGKSGTSSLYHYLNRHPKVYMSPVKEPNFFALEGESLSFFGGPEAQETINSWSVTDLETYRKLFDGVSDETAIGEASVLYLYSPDAPRNIRRHIPEARLIAILRNPVDRAFSAYMQLRRDGWEPYTDFARALREEEARIKANRQWLWHYKRAGFYYPQLMRYYETFDPDQIKVCLYEDLMVDPEGLLRDLFEFIGVGRTLADERLAKAATARYNASGIPRSKTLYDFLNYPNPLKTILKPFVPRGLRQTAKERLSYRNLAKPQLPPEVRQDLAALYREDILKLQELIGRDLSSWIEE